MYLPTKFQSYRASRDNLEFRNKEVYIFKPLMNMEDGT